MRRHRLAARLTTFSPGGRDRGMGAGRDTPGTQGLGSPTLYGLSAARLLVCLLFVSH